MQHADTGYGQHTQGAEAAIRALDAQWSKDATAKDLDAVVSLYAPDGTLAWQGEPAMHGTEAIRAGWTTMMRMPGLSLHFTPQRIDVAGAGDMAIDFGEVDLGYDGDAGRVEMVAKYLVVWKQVGGAWKVLYDSYNTNEEPSS